MKRNSLGTLSFAVLSLVLTTGAHAQSVEEATVPFSFQAGATQLPAGHYLIKEDHIRESVKIWKVDSGLVVIVPVMQNDLVATKSALVFHTVGDQHFLAEISAGAMDLTLAPSKTEKQAQRTQVAAAGSQHVLVALK